MDVQFLFTLADHRGFFERRTTLFSIVNELGLTKGLAP